MIKQALRAIKIAENKQAESVAKLHQTYINGHLKEGREPLDLIAFMPHPTEWQLQTIDRKLSIKSETAHYVLEALSWLGPEPTALIEPMLIEIRAIAQGE